MLHAVAQAGLVLVTLSIAGLLYRLVRGPSAPDRILALDAMTVNAIAFVALFSVVQETTLYIHLFLAMAIIAVLGSVAVASFLIHGAAIERGEDGR